MKNNSLNMYNLFYSCNFIKICIHFYCISKGNYANFEYFLTDNILLI